MTLITSAPRDLFDDGDRANEAVVMRRHLLSPVTRLLLLSVALSGCECDEPLQKLPGRLIGTVCDPRDGEPVAAAPFFVDVNAAQVAAGNTDAAGGVAVNRLDPGSGVLRVEMPSGVREFAFTAVIGETAVIVDPSCRAIPPQPGTGDLEGVICNRHIGENVTGATVSVLLDDGTTVSTTTDENGAFYLGDVPVGARVVVVDSPTYRRTYVVDIVEGGLAAIPGDECTNPDLTLGLLSGVFCDPASDGDFLVGADVVVTDAASEVYRELTDQNGAFLAGPMAPGSASVVVSRGDVVVATAVGFVVAGAETQVSGGGSCEPLTCIERSVVIEAPAELELLLIVDRSGSMNAAAPGYGTTRWRGVRSAIEAVTAENDDRIAFGMSFFPAIGAVEGCETADVDLAPALGQADAIATLLADFDTEPLGATPTAAALFAARAFFRANPTTSPRAVLLATDGGPNCNASLDPFSCTCSSGDDQSCADAAFDDPALAASLCLDDNNAVAAVGQLAADGVDTYVVGIPGVENFSSVLRAMSVAGRTLQPGPTGFYLASDNSRLESAINDINRRARGCTVDIADLGDVDLRAGAVIDLTIDGAVVERDAAHLEGFDVVDEDTVELFGAACDELVSGGLLLLNSCTVDAGDGVTP